MFSILNLETSEFLCFIYILQKDDQLEKNVH